MLKIGVAKVNITPPIGVPLSGYEARKKISQGIHDELYAKALVLDDGEKKIALVVSDLLYLDKDFTESVRRQIEGSTGISSKNVMVTVTHTHAGPVGCCLDFMYRLEDESVINSKGDEKLRCSFTQCVGEKDRWLRLHCDPGHDGRENGTGQRFSSHRWH